MASQQQDASTGAYLIRGAAILGGAPEDLLIRDGIIAERGQTCPPTAPGGERDCH